MLISPTFRHGAARLLARSALALALGGAGLAPSQSLADPPGEATIAPAASDNAGPPTLTPFAGDAALEDRLDRAGRLVVAGERLHEHLLRRFYLAHGFKPVWDSHAAAAASLSDAVLGAGGQGLDPALFHAAALSRRGAAMPAVERELLLSDAFLAYADALARGAVPVEARYDDEDLRPEPVDVVAALDTAMAAPDPARAIARLAPSSPEYSAMLQAYAGYRAAAAGGASPGVRARNARWTRESGAEAGRRARQLAVNLERLRWLPRHLPADRLVVDTAAARLQLFRDDQPIFTTKVVVGEFDKQTPELQSIIKDVLFNPPWNIPRSIIEKEILPKLAHDRNYLAEHHMRYRGPMAIQQVAGPYSALGRLKFEMEDRFDVYLHDTPEKARFGAADRMMSHGCVRVENPRELASLLLGEAPEVIDKAIGVNRTHRRALPKPLPVFLVYRTAEFESNGSIAFRGDPYQRDNEIWEHLIWAQQPPIAQDLAANQRKG